MKSVFHKTGKLKKINIHSYFFSSFCNIILPFFFFKLIMCKFCATSGPPPWLVEYQNKNDFDRNQLTFIDFFLKKVLSHQMESKVKNSISQQAEQVAMLSGHSRVDGKKAWDIKNKKRRTQKSKTFSLHWNRNTQVALQVLRPGVSRLHF